jgi:hypothetical protein
MPRCIIAALGETWSENSSIPGLVAKVVHGPPTRFSDPASFSFALVGGKDGYPFPMPLKTTTRP